MIDKRRAARRRIALAVALSLAGHAGFIALLVLDLDRDSQELAVAPVVEVTFTPPEPPPEPDTSHVKAAASSRVATRQIAASPLPYALPASIAAGPGPSPAAAPAQTPAELKAGCIGKRGNQEEQVDCKLEVWSFFDGKPARDPGDAIPADKRAEYAAVAQRQARQRTPAARLGNASDKTCPQSNLGTGCADDMLLPFFVSGPRKAER